MKYPDLDSFECRIVGISFFFAPKRTTDLMAFKSTTEFLQMDPSCWRVDVKILVFHDCSTSFNESCPHVHGKIGL